MTSHIRLATLLALSAIAACGACSGPVAASPTTMAEVIAYYDCGAGGLVSIRFSNADAVLTFLNRQDHASLPHALRQQLAADGFAYAGEGFALRGVGNHIALSGPLGAEFERCPVIRPPQ